MSALFQNQISADNNRRYHSKPRDTKQSNQTCSLNSHMGIHTHDVNIDLACFFGRGLVGYEGDLTKGGTGQLSTKPGAR